MKRRPAPFVQIATAPIEGGGIEVVALDAAGVVWRLIAAGAPPGWYRVPMERRAGGPPKKAAVRHLRPVP